MEAPLDYRTVFMTTVGTQAEKTTACLLIDSLRPFGGGMSQAPFWLFETNSPNVSCRNLESDTVCVIPLDVPQVMQDYYFGGKVFACARAEELVLKETRSLVVVDPTCAIVNPPRLYALDEDYDAAVRPVHIQNVGLSSDEPLDDFWKGICTQVGIQDIGITVDSFVDVRHLRAYFNSHAFSINPSKGLMRRWLELFENLVKDHDFQATACQDERHRIFLFQAILSALLVSTLNPARIRILPPAYNYPYNLQASIPAERRARALNDLVSFTYEGRSLDPTAMDDIEVREPLRSWLSEHVMSGPL